MAEVSGGEPLGRVFATSIAPHRHRRLDQDLLVFEPNLDMVEWVTVVDDAAHGLGKSVCGDDIERQMLGHGRAAEEDEPEQRLLDPTKCGEDERDVGDSIASRVHDAVGIESLVHRERDVAETAASEHRHAPDMARREAEQPVIVGGRVESREGGAGRRGD